MGPLFDRIACDCRSETVATFSGVAYHFAEKLHRDLDGIPIGVINTSWGGTEIEPWTNLEGFSAVPSLEPWAEEVTALLADSSAEVNAQTPSAIYNAMIHPLAPFTLAGFTWYQGGAYKGGLSSLVTCGPSLTDCV